jgi:hypothetical protein
MNAVIGSHDIYLDAVPCSIPSTSSPTATPQPTALSPELDSFCRNVTHLQDELLQETTYLDCILTKLHSYCQEVKTKRQLGFNVPPRKSMESLECEDTQDHLLSVTEEVTSPTTTTNSQSEPIFIPIVRSVDKASTSLAKKVSMSEDSLRASLGFHWVDSIRHHFLTLYQDTITFNLTPADAVLDNGDFATMHKTDCNTVPVPRPKAFGDVMHINIVFGPEVSLGNVHYGLLITDRYSRMSYVYPLQNLWQDIRKQLECFFAHIGIVKTYK